MSHFLDALKRTLTDLWRWRSGGLTTALFWIWFGLALLSALPIFLVTQWLTKEAESARFAVAAEQAAHRLTRDIDLTLANLRAVTGLYQGSVHVSREEFSAFVQALRPSAAVQSLEWVPRVPAAARARAEQAARRDGLSTFAFREDSDDGRIIPSGQRPEYFPIYYIEPYHDNQSSLGRDLGADSTSLDALRRARKSGEQAASGRVELLGRHEDQYGIVLFEPIYSETALDLDTRINKLEGFARGVFRVADLVRQAIPEDQFRVTVLDLSASPSKRQLYPAANIEGGDDRQNAIEHNVSLAIADRVWSVRMAPVTVSALSTYPWIAAVTWLGAFLVLWTVRELVFSRRHGQQLAAVNNRLETLSHQREQAIKELKRSNQELDDFAYIVSHDLKEPLRAISNHAAFLLEDYEERLDPDGEKRLHRLVILSQRMQKLIGDLLYFSRLGRGETALEYIDLNDVIADIETNLGEALDRQNATIVRAGLLPKIKGHRPQITTLFQNLIVNGILYNDAERKVIEVGYSADEIEGSPSREGHFYVRDNGIGIDERFKDEIFRIFRRLNSEETYGEGSGAGLSFVKKIVEGHGGTIWLTSAVAKGTTFYFTLGKADLPQAEGLHAEAA